MQNLQPLLFKERHSGKHIPKESIRQNPMELETHDQLEKLRLNSKALFFNSPDSRLGSASVTKNAINIISKAVIVVALRQAAVRESLPNNILQYLSEAFTEA